MLEKSKVKAPSRFLILAFCFVATRLVFLLFAQPVYLYVFRMEELYRGAMAMELIRGSLETFYQYRPDNYAGGSFVIGGIASIFFRIFPATALTLKMVSVCWSGAALAVWYQAVKRFENAKTALCAALFFIFSPPVFLRYSLAPIGDHAETILFAGAELLILSYLTRNSRYKAILSALLGVIAGFGVWFAYIHVFAVTAVVAFWYVSDRGLFRSRNFWIFVLFFFVGFSPWIILNIKEHAAGLKIQSQPLWTCFDIKNFAKRILNFRDSSPYLLFSYFDLFDPPFPAARAAIWFYRILFFMPLAIVSFQWFQNKQRFPDLKSRPLIFMSVVYLSLFSLVVQFTQYNAVRYWVPAQPFLFLLVLFAVQYLFRNRTYLLSSFFTVLISGSLLFYGNQLSFAERGYAFRQLGYSHAWLSGSPVCSSSQPCLAAYRYFRERLAEDEKRSLILDLSLSLASDLPFENLDESLNKAEEVLPKEVLGIFYYALGYEIYTRNQQDFVKSLAFVNTRLKTRAEKYYRLSLWGVLDVGLNQFEPIPVSEMRRIRADIPDFAVREYWRKRGFEWMQALLYLKAPRAPFHSEVDAMLRQLKLEEIPFFVQGLGMGLYGHWRMNQKTGYLTAEVFSALLPRIQKAMAEGGGIASSKLPEWDQRVMREMFFRTVSTSLREDFEKSGKLRDIELDALGYSF